jgi:hypothetical protein
LNPVYVLDTTVCDKVCWIPFMYSIQHYVTKCVESRLCTRYNIMWQSVLNPVYVLDTTLCDKVCQLLAAGRWFSPVSSTNKTDRHDINGLLLKMALNTITLTPKYDIYVSLYTHKQCIRLIRNVYGFIYNHILH